MKSYIYMLAGAALHELCMYRMYVQEFNRKDDPKLKHYKVKSAHYNPTLTLTTHCRHGMIDYNQMYIT